MFTRHVKQLKTSIVGTQKVSSKIDPLNTKRIRTRLMNATHHFIKFPWRGYYRATIANINGDHHVLACDNFPKRFLQVTYNIQVVENPIAYQLKFAVMSI
jgi:hypothetical protein